MKVIDGIEIMARFNSGMGGVTVDWPSDRGSLLSLTQAKELAVAILEAWDAARCCRRPELRPGVPWSWDIVIDSAEEMEANSRA